MSPDADGFGPLRLSEVVSALSYALDLTGGLPGGHAVRTCLVGMRLGEVVGLDASDRSALFYALLLKDVGCSSNAARVAQVFQSDDHALKLAYRLTDFSRPAESATQALGTGAVEERQARAWQSLLAGPSEPEVGRELVVTRCERGAGIASLLGLERATADAIRALDEHWDGAGLPYNKGGEQIPLLGRIVALAQTVELFAHSYGPEAAYEIARRRKGSWFDPSLVEALDSFRHDHTFWSTLAATDQLEFVSDLEPADQEILADETRLDYIAEAFARVIDAKSPYTALHSERVAALAVAIAEVLGCPPVDIVMLRRAGLLHDIGKLGVSNLVLDKPGKLTEAEMSEVRKHPRYTAEILGRVRGFSRFADIAAAHHERLDGSGYHLGRGEDDLPLLHRILAVADVAEALSSARPYRQALPRDEVLRMVRRESGALLCPDSVEALAGIATWPLGLSVEASER